MARVCLVGDPAINLKYELLSRETSREALATYEFTEPFENSLAVETVSLGAAVALCNDLNWYIVRFVEEALILEGSISKTEWLSRELAEQIREGDIPPEETDRLLKVYGVVDDELVEPMYLTRVDDSVPEYDLRDVDDTVTVRVSEREFAE